jgi:pentatricopeptide repeat protein
MDNFKIFTFFYSRTPTQCGEQNAPQLMPPRLNLLTKRWSPFDLPILPFLAPRVFQPWPWKGHRVYSGTAQAAQQKSEAVREAYEDLPLENDGGGSRSAGSTSQIQRPKRGVYKERHDCNRALSNDANDEVHSLQQLKECSGGSVESQYLDAESYEISGEEFRRKYEAIWGRRRKRPRERSRNIDVLPLGSVSSAISDEDDFSRRYEEIWSPQIKKPPLTLPVRRVQGDRKQPETTRHARPQSINFTYFFSKRGFKRRYEALAKERARQQWVDEKKLLTTWKTRSRLQDRARNIPDSRPKFARHRPYVSSKIYTSFRPWHRRFAILNLRHEALMRGLRPPRHGFKPTSKFPATFLRDLMNKGNSHGLYLIWTKFRPRRKMEIWPELMIKALQSRPNKVLKIIAGTYFQEPFPPPYALSDCLNYVVSYFLGGTISPSRTLVRNMLNSIFGLLRIGPEDYLHISQRSAYLLLSHAAHADPYHLKKLYKIMAEINHPLHENTLMQFAYHLAKAKETDTALEIIRKLKNYGSDFNTPQMLSLCSTVLDRSFRGPDTSLSDSDIFEYMLEWGMQPNIITYNVLVKNSVDIGNNSTAWQIHDMMIESGIEPDAYTYSILLNDSKERMDSEAIEAVMDLVRKKNLRSAYIVNDVLDAIFLLHQQRTKKHDQPSEPQAAFYHMLKVYMENFRIEPLARIIPWISEMPSNIQRPESPLIPQDELESPPAPTRILMITAFLYGSPDPWTVRHFYDHFRHLSSTGDPVIADFLQTTHIWNSVLMAFGKFPDTLGDCTAVIGDMLAPVKAAHENEDPLKQASSQTDESFETQSRTEISKDGVETSRFKPMVEFGPARDSLPQLLGTPEEQPRKPHIPPKPDVYTWSLLLKIFMKHKQTRAAEKVFTMMQEKGVEPNISTWTSLAMGYARLQDTENAVDVLTRMDRAGFGADARSLAFIFKIRDRRGLLEAMREKGNKELNPGAEFLGQLQNDMRSMRENEQSRALDADEDEGDFVLWDLEDDTEDRTIGRTADKSDTREEVDDNVETSWEQEPEYHGKE